MKIRQKHRMTQSKGVSVEIRETWQVWEVNKPGHEINLITISNLMRYPVYVTLDVQIRKCYW